MDRIPDWNEFMIVTQTTASQTHGIHVWYIYLHLAIKIMYGIYLHLP